MDLDFYENDDIDFTDIFNEEEIEDLIPSSLKEFSEINEILINQYAKKSFNSEKNMFTNKVNSINPSKNIYLKSILKNIKSYLNAKNKKTYILNFINKTLTDDKNLIDDWLVKKNKRIKKILDDLNLSYLKNNDLYHFYIDSNNKKLRGMRLITFLDKKNKRLEICIFDFYHLFTISKLSNYKKNYERNKFHKKDIKDFFESTNRKGQ